jgi:hypothetical protein
LIIVSSSGNVEEDVITLSAVITSDRPMSISKSDYIFLAVPLNALSVLIDEINIHKKPNAIVIDCCSARVPSEKTLARLNCQHFGMHDVKSREYCITGKIDAGMKDFFKKNISINIVSPEEHDHIKTAIGIGFYCSFHWQIFNKRRKRNFIWYRLRIKTDVSYKPFRRKYSCNMA